MKKSRKYQSSPDFLTGRPNKGSGSGGRREAGVSSRESASHPCRSQHRAIFKIFTSVYCGWITRAQKLGNGKTVLGRWLDVGALTRERAREAKRDASQQELWSPSCCVLGLLEEVRQCLLLTSFYVRLLLTFELSRGKEGFRILA